MQINNGMLTQYSRLGNGLRVEDAPQRSASVHEKISGGVAGGDSVTISEEGRSMARGAVSGASASGESSETSTQDQMIERMKEQIEKLQEEIKELQNEASLPEEEKRKLLQMKQAELMQLQTQLQQAQQEQLKAKGLSLGGGTRAQGFANSLS